eukprot:176809-Rhodomonas_salina.2
MSSPFAGILTRPEVVRWKLITPHARDQAVDTITQSIQKLEKSLVCAPPLSLSLTPSSIFSPRLPFVQSQSSTQFLRSPCARLV